MDIGNRYRTGKTLGQGGMGTVVEATHLELGTQVAIKILRSDRTDAEASERFLREARAAAALHGEHICRVHDFGRTDDGSPYMVMELLAGRDLAAILDDGPLDPHKACAYMVQACLALAEAHAAGIIHRDLKPRNLFIVDRPDGTTTLKVLDFGIAKSQQKSATDLTETMNVMGSPAYMSPEQLKSSKRADARSDIWSLGVVLYELLSEKQPFVGDSLTELVLNISNEPPTPLPDSIPPEITRIVMKCLEKDPAKRYQDVGALAASIRRATNVTTMRGASGQVSAVPSRARSRLRFAFLLLAVAVVVGVATLIITLSLAPQPPTPANVPTPAVVTPDAAIDAEELDAASIDSAADAQVEPDAAEPAATVPDAAPEAPKKLRKKGNRRGKDLRNSRY